MNNNRFRNHADLLLGGLQWTRADANAVLSAAKGERRKRKRKVSLGLALAIVLVLLAAVALAIGLSYSPRYTAVQGARHAVMDKYGLTPDMLRLYTEELQVNETGLTARYRGASSEFLKAEPMGDYSVTVSGAGRAVATWTHDGVDASTLETGDLTGDVWGPKQLQMALERYAYYLQWKMETPYLPLLPIAEQAKRIAQLDEAVAPCRIAITRTQVPNEDDLPEDKALALAMQAVKDAYGVEMTEEWRIARRFQTKSDGASDDRYYTFHFQRGGENDAPYETYEARVWSPSPDRRRGASNRLPGHAKRIWLDPRRNPRRHVNLRISAGSRRRLPSADFFQSDSRGFTPATPTRALPLIRSLGRYAAQKWDT